MTPSRSQRHARSVRLGHHLVVDAGLARARAAIGRARRPSATSRRTPIAGHDLAAELDAVDAAQRRPRLGGLAVAIEQQDGRRLRQRLDHQHARHQRRAREVALEEVFADRDVLDRFERAPALVRDDGVHEGHRVAIATAGRARRGDGGHWTRERPGTPGRVAARPPKRPRRNSQAVAAGAAAATRALRLRRGRGGGVELLDDVGGDVEARIGPDDAGIDAAEDHVQALGRRHLGEHRQELRWNSSCSSFCRSSTAFWASWVARCRSVCSRSTSFCWVPRTDSLSTEALVSSRLRASSNFALRATRSFSFSSRSDVSRLVAAWPSADSEAMRWTFT